MRVLLGSVALVSTLLLCIPAFAEAGSTKVRLREISIYDQSNYAGAGLSLPLVDVVQNICSTEGDVVNYEPFFDTVAALKVLNKGVRTVKFTKFWYQVKIGSSTFTSTKFPPVAPLEVEPGETKQAVLSLLFKAHGGSKFFTGSSDPISSALGFHDLKFFMQGADTKGKRVLVKGTITLSFDDYDRCE